MTHWWHELLSLYLAGIGLWLAALGVVELVAWRLRRRVKRYRVVWFSPAGVPPTWLAWERHGCEAYTAVVRATGPDAAGLQNQHSVVAVGFGAGTAGNALLTMFMDLVKSQAFRDWLARLVEKKA